MEVAIWDTYVKRDNGKIMHFDILVPSELTSKDKIFNFGMQYLNKKSFSTKKLSTKESKFCHVGNASKEVIKSIHKKGYYIIEMENCH